MHLGQGRTIKALPLILGDHAFARKKGYEFQDHRQRTSRAGGRINLNTLRNCRHDRFPENCLAGKLAGVTATISSQVFEIW
jgi:hypothetical protein